MEQWRKDSRSEAIIVDLEALVPLNHLLRKIEKVMEQKEVPKGESGKGSQDIFRTAAV